MYLVGMKSCSGCITLTSIERKYWERDINNLPVWMETMKNATVSLWKVQLVHTPYVGYWNRQWSRYGNALTVVMLPPEIKWTWNPEIKRFSYNQIKKSSELICQPLGICVQLAFHIATCRDSGQVVFLYMRHTIPQWPFVIYFNN